MLTDQVFREKHDEISNGFERIQMEHPTFKRIPLLQPRHLRVDLMLILNIPLTLHLLYPHHRAFQFLSYFLFLSNFVSLGQFFVFSFFCLKFFSSKFFESFFFRVEVFFLRVELLFTVLTFCRKKRGRIIILQTVLNYILELQLDTL